jgi:hypothetical protein
MNNITFSGITVQLTTAELKDEFNDRHAGRFALLYLEVKDSPQDPGAESMILAHIKPDAAAANVLTFGLNIHSINFQAKEMSIYINPCWFSCIREAIRTEYKQTHKGQ